MTWVQKHIAAFNGDAKKVTIFGEGAGANSIFHHLVEQSANGLYQRAIIQSGANPNNTIPFDEAQKNYNHLADLLQCVDLTCLLAKTAKDVKEVHDFRPTRWGPVIDGAALVEHPIRLMAQGLFNKEATIM